MRKVCERDWQRQVVIQQMVNDTKAELEQAQIATVRSMDHRMEFLLNNPNAEKDDPSPKKTTSALGGMSSWMADRSLMCLSCEK